MRQLLIKINLFVLALFFLTEVSCEDLYKGTDYSYQVSEQLEDRLEVATLKQVGVDSLPLIDAVSRIGRGKYGEIHSVLIYKDERLVLEEYFPGHSIPSGGDIQGAGGLKFTPRDMVKIGSMMLHKGIWNGKRIISEEWVSKCTKLYGGNNEIKVPGEDLGNVGYGYTWWTKQSVKYGEMFFALG